MLRFHVGCISFDDINRCFCAGSEGINHIKKIIRKCPVADGPILPFFWKPYFAPKLIPEQNPPFSGSPNSAPGAEKCAPCDMGGGRGRLWSTSRAYNKFLQSWIRLACWWETSQIWGDPWVQRILALDSPQILRFRQEESGISSWEARFDFET